MKLSLSVKISIKEIFPEKLKCNNFTCLFTYNNFNRKINLSDLNNQNSINHKVECFNSNIIYNMNIIDSNKNSLIGIGQLFIYFDKIKNLNINDTLTQEEKVKLIIDSKTKRKIFDNVYNNGEIYLYLLTEIKIIDKNIIEFENKKIFKNAEEKELNRNKNNLECSNSTPRNYKKKGKIKSTKKEREAIKRVDTFSNYNEINIADYLADDSIKNSTPNSLLQKNKSLQKIQKHSINKINAKKNKNNKDLRHRAIKSCIEIPSIRHNKTNYNSKLKKEEKENQKNIIPKPNGKMKFQKKKVTILNLIEEKLNPILYKSKEESIVELNELSKDFKNTSSINFSKSQINKVNANLKKYSSRTLNKNKFINSKEKIQYNINKKISNDNEETHYFQKKNKNNQMKNKINIDGNLNDKNKDNKDNKDNKSISSLKSEREKEIKTHRILSSKLFLNNTGRLNTDMNKLKLKNNNNFNLNNAILQTEIANRKLSEQKNNSKIYKNKHILTEIDLEQLIIERGAYIKGNFNNLMKEKNRGTFSPKLSLKFKFKEKTVLNTNRNNAENKFDKLTYRYKEINNKKLLTPKGNQKKLISFLNNISKEDNSYIEKEEIKKKYVNLIDFYSLLSKKLKKTNKNNIDIAINFETIKEKYNYLQKQKNKLIQKIKTNESKQIINKSVYHNEHKQIANKMINVKLKENSIYQNIFGPQFNEEETQNKIQILIMQKKEMILNMIKNIVKFYGNISQIYNNDRDKREKLKSILNKYGIKEKVKIDLNYITHIHKENNFEDKIITEVDEDKENEEDEEEIKPSLNNINNQINQINQINNINNINNNYQQYQQINENNIINNNHENKIIIKNTVEGLNDVYKEVNPNNNLNNSYDENLNNLIKKILLEEFPVKYKTNLKFNYLDKNKYSFENKIFFGFIKDNDIILKEDNDNNIFTLNEFYQKYCCTEKKDNKLNFVYTKKIKQKYIKIKNNDKEQSMDKKPKNENSTTISDNDKKQQSILSRLNEMGEMKNSMSD